MKEHIAHSGAWGLVLIVIVVASWFLYRYLAPKTWKEWAEVAGKLAEPRYITFTEQPGSGLTKEVADSMWEALCKWIEPYREASGPVTFRKCQRLVSPELREAKLITGWPKDGLRHTWISSLLALGVSRDWVAELAGNSPGIIWTNYKRPLPEDVAKSWFTATEKSK